MCSTNLKTLRFFTFFKKLFSTFRNWPIYIILYLGKKKKIPLCGNCGWGGWSWGWGTFCCCCTCCCCCCCCCVCCGRVIRNTSMRHVGQVCWRWNQDLKQLAWKMWLHGNFLQAVTISSLHIMQTLSPEDSSSAVASGYLKYKII